MEKVWIVVQNIKWEECSIIGIFPDALSAVNLQADCVNAARDNQNVDSSKITYSRYKVPFGEINVYNL